MRNGSIWLDSRGERIQAHGGMILEWEGRYYWYGEHKGGVTRNRRADVIGISCYRSENMKDWDYLGLVLEADPANPDSPLHPSKVCERPKVLYNRKTEKFVMWVHSDNADYTYAGVSVAVSDRPEGPFKLLRTFHPNRQDSRDMTLFEDIDGRAYLIHSSNFNKTMNIARLTEDCLDVDGFYANELVNQEREAPAVFFWNGTYYMITSGCTGWTPNSALYATCRSVIGGWKLIDNPCEGAGCHRTFGGQSAYVFMFRGMPWLMLDHWNPDDLGSSGYSILPITFRQDGTMTVVWQEEFLPDAQ